jgi:uncharacterized membrane protein
MVAQTQTLTSSRPEPSLLPAAVVAIALFAGSWSLLHVWFYTHKQVRDTPIYQRYGNAMTRGEVPYRDFSVEYPPGALPMFALPGFAEPGRDQDVSQGFRRAFETLMWLCGAGALLAMVSTLASISATRAHLWRALAFAALAPLALGAVILSRFDLWPTALVVASLAAFAAGWMRVGAVALGAAIATKLFPVVLVPLGIAYVWRREGRREALVCAGIVAVVVAVIFAPFVVLSPSGVWDSVSGQLSRPLQIESLGSALLIALHHVAGTHVDEYTSHGSQNLHATGASALAVVETVVLAAALIALWAWFARSDARPSTLVRAYAAAIALFIAFGKVLSPQFMIWLIPLVPLVRGRRGLWATGLFGGALVLTQLFFPYRYWSLVREFGVFPSWLLLARDVMLVALAAVLALPSRGQATETRTV